VKIGTPMWNVYSVFLCYIGSNRENLDKYYGLLINKMKTGPNGSNFVLKNDY